MRHEQVVRVRLQFDFADIAVNEVNARDSNSAAGQLDHPTARLDAIDCRVGMSHNELGKEASVPLADDKHSSRPSDLAQKGDASLLQPAAENERLEAAIIRRDPVEIHRT